MGDPHFRRNLLYVAAFHILLIAALLYFARREVRRSTGDIVWLDAGAFSQIAQESGALPAAAQEPTAESTPEPTPPPTPEPTPPPAPEPTPEIPEPTPPPTPEPIQEEETIPLDPTPKPQPTATPKATPTPTPKATPKPTPTPTPKETPKPTVTPKPTAKPSPKLTPKASPKPSPSPKGSPKELAASKATPAATASPNAGGSPSAKASGSPAAKPAKSAGSGPQEARAGSAEKSGGGGGQAQFGWYHELIHDRFYSQWDQPTSIFDSSKSFVCTLQIRIESDGKISGVKVLKSSGNVVMDDSVMAAAHRVTQIDPPPTSLSSGGAYTVNINFELQ